MTITERIRKFDTDYFGFCRASAMINLGMDAMIRSMEAEGLDRTAMLERYNAVWMAAHFKYQLDRPLYADMPLEMEVGPLCCDRGHALSRLLFKADGQAVGQALSAWILADIDGRKILRPQTVAELQDRPAAPRGLFRRGIKPPAGAALCQRTVHYSDCDVNGHFNSPRYADCICDAHGMEKLPSGYVSQMQVSFSAESKPGEILDIYSWQEDGLFMTHAACGGQARFSACFVRRLCEKVK